MPFPYVFHRRSSKTEQEKADVNETFRTLMEARFDRLENNFAALRTQWADSNDKLMHLYDRIRKRVKVTEKTPEDEKPVVPAMTPQDERDLVLQSFKSINGR